MKKTVDLPEPVTTSENGRGERIRTSGPCLPKAVLYQAELHPDWVSENMDPMRRQNDRGERIRTSGPSASRRQ